ncbi:hypothetical protein GOV05_01430 [Candidatus Woesearchaeota archaeon]|nr:hypothetical protein [Candidatus Woesearchaeota archaeon]
MLLTTIKLIRNKKGDLAWTQIGMFILAIIVLATMIYVIFRSKEGFSRVGDEIAGFLS